MAVMALGGPHLVVLAVIAGIGAYLTAPRPGARMDPDSTGPDGAHALVALLRDGGVEVVVANSIADVEQAARPDTLILVAQSQYLTDTTLLDRLANSPRRSAAGGADGANPRSTAAGRARVGRQHLRQQPELHAARGQSGRAGSIRASDTYQAKDGRAMTSCYDGVLIRFRDDGRTVTAVGSTDFMTNGGLLQAGNAALAMNLAGDRPRLIWYAPHRIEGETSSPASVFDLIPENVTWIVVAAVPGRAAGGPVEGPPARPAGGRGAARRGARVGDRRGPRPALPVAPGTRSRRGGIAHRDRCSGCCPGSAWARARQPPAVVTSVAQRSGADPGFVSYHLFGPPPATDHDLLQLARALDDIERQVAHT